MPAAKRKPGRGGARPGAGRPVSTGAGANRIVFRVSNAQRDELAAEATRLGLSSAALAAKRRVFS